MQRLSTRRNMAINKDTMHIHNFKVDKFLFVGEHPYTSYKRKASTMHGKIISFKTDNTKFKMLVRASIHFICIGSRHMNVHPQGMVRKTQFACWSSTKTPILSLGCKRSVGSWLSAPHLGGPSPPRVSIPRSSICRDAECKSSTCNLSRYTCPFCMEIV